MWHHIMKVFTNLLVLKHSLAYKTYETFFFLVREKVWCGESLINPVILFFTHIILEELYFFHNIWVMSYFPYIWETFYFPHNIWQRSYFSLTKFRLCHMFSNVRGMSHFSIWWCHIPSNNIWGTSYLSHNIWGMSCFSLIIYGRDYIFPQYICFFFSQIALVQY